VPLKKNKYQAPIEQINTLSMVLLPCTTILIRNDFSKLVLKTARRPVLLRQLVDQLLQLLLQATREPIIDLDDHTILDHDHPWVTGHAISIH